MAQTPSLVNLSEIAQDLEIPEHKVRYTLRSRRIAPTIRHAGRLWFSRRAVEQIHAAIVQIDSKKLSYPIYGGASAEAEQGPGE